MKRQVVFRLNPTKKKCTTAVNVIDCMKDCRNAQDYLYMLSVNQIKTFLRSILQLYESLTRILI